ncbi:hypothetical protein ACQ4M4_06955 [Leptolyngbya sp. AN02str]|uniref:hypothetical protein n=1 Tax=Leptolyngbya sp. AN02str TaxID=3423363 RepID=UPI003D3178E9
MTSTPHSETPVDYYELTAQRKAGTGAPRARTFFGVAQAISDGLSVPPLRHSVTGPRLAEFSEQAIEAWFTALEQLAKDGKSNPWGLTNRSRDSRIDLFYNCYQLPFPTEEVQFTLPKQVQLDPLLSTFERICVEFEPFYAYTLDRRLQKLHGRRERYYQMRLEITPPKEHSQIPKPIPIEGVVDTLPPLLFQQEIDRVQVPEGVWWINFWTPTQVENVGVERVRNAGWSRIIERPAGFLLVATEEPTSVYNSAHLAKLGEMVEALNLKEVQEQYRVRPHWYRRR